MGTFPYEFPYVTSVSYKLNSRLRYTVLCGIANILFLLCCVSVLGQQDGSACPGACYQPDDLDLIS